MRRNAGAMPWLAALAAAAMLAIPLPANASSWSTDWSDAWGNASESGWGVLMSQQADVVFAALYVYDTQGNPTWYTAALLPVSGTTQLRGDLYVTRGPWFGAPVFNGAAVDRRMVGQMTLTSVNVDRAQLAYTVDGVAVTKAIARTLLRNENFAGHYGLWMKLTISGCTSTQTGFTVAEAWVTHTATGLTVSADMVVDEDTMLSCTWTGDYGQAGRFGHSQGTYVCGSDRGPHAFTELQLQPDTFAGRIRFTTADGCMMSGTFAGVRD